MKLLWLISLFLALNGCVSAKKYHRDIDTAYAQGEAKAFGELMPYKSAYINCTDNLKEIQDKYYKVYGRFIKEQNNARTDK